MFGTLKIGSEKDSAEFIEHAKGEAARRLGGYVFSHSACERCRLKKLRCNKHKSGCDRCKIQHLKCSYQTDPDSNSSRPKTRRQTQAQTHASSSDGSETARTSNALSPVDNNDVDREISWWQMVETDPTGSVPPRASQPLRDLTHVDQMEQSSLSDLQLEYCENEFEGTFSNIGSLQPDSTQPHEFMVAAGRALLDAEAFDSMTVTANSILDDIGDKLATQPASSDSQPSFLAVDDARSSCHCQRSILHVLAEIESKILSTSPSNMYATLAYQRQTTTLSNAILTYDICKCRIEFFGLLSIIAEKITSLCEAIITAFICRVKEQNGSDDSAESDTSSDRHLECDTAMRLAEFQIQTLQEFKVVSAAIIKLQLKCSVTFVSRTRELATSMSRLAQAQSLNKLESRLSQLFIEVQQVTTGS